MSKDITKLQEFGLKFDNLKIGSKYPLKNYLWYEQIVKFWAKAMIDLEEQYKQQLKEKIEKDDCVKVNGFISVEKLKKLLEK